MSEFNKVDSFKFWCQKILPLVYDDSLSYYEVLCKVVKTLNEVIENTNNIPDIIAEYIGEEKLKEILATLLTTIQAQIAKADEGTSETATADRGVGDLVWLNGLLYQVIKNMDAGDKYVVDSNISKVTIENLLRVIRDAICDNVESNSSTTTTARSVGDLVWYKNKLYRITQDMSIGTAYVIGSNCVAITIDELMKVIYHVSDEELEMYGIIDGTTEIVTGDVHTYDSTNSAIVITEA